MDIGTKTAHALTLTFHLLYVAVKDCIDKEQSNISFLFYTLGCLSKFSVTVCQSFKLMLRVYTAVIPCHIIVRRTSLLN